VTDRNSFYDTTIPLTEIWNCQSSFQWVSDSQALLIGRFNNQMIFGFANRAAMLPIESPL